MDTMCDICPQKISQFCKLLDLKKLSKFKILYSAIILQLKYLYIIYVVLVFKGIPQFYKLLDLKNIINIRNFNSYNIIQIFTHNIYTVHSQENPTILWIIKF